MAHNYADRLARHLNEEARAILQDNGGGIMVANDFGEWLVETQPDWHWDWPHLAYIRAQLDRVTAGEINKLMIFVPPRHGKTEMTTVRYPIFRLEQYPALRVIIGAYNQKLANKFSIKARRVAKQRRIPLSKERSAIDDWETTDGGGIWAVGVGSGVTGQGGDLIIVDDPVKNREEAESETYREAVWEWYTDDLYTRLEPGGAIIVILTRWHEDDLAGRILASDDGPNWTVIRLPANAEPDDPLGRGQVTCPKCLGSKKHHIQKNAPCYICDGTGKVGEALCRDRYDEVALADKRAVLGNSYFALYQQRPQPRGGSFFKTEWFQTVDVRPAASRRVRYWDTAGTEGRGDFTVGVLMARTPSGQYVIEDVVRGQWSPHNKDQEILAAAQRDAQLFGQYGFEIWLEHEAGIGGKERSAATVKLLAGFRVNTEHVTGSKEVRAEPLASQAQAGNVHLLRGHWNRAFLDELATFPRGRNDDQVDAAAGAFNKLTLTGSGILHSAPFSPV